MKILKRSECVVMPLVLTYEWYDAIDKKGKREEYRADTPRYGKRFYNLANRSCRIIGDKFMKKVVAFSRAYTKPDMFWLCEIEFRQDGKRVHPEWGEPEEAHWVLRLIERVKMVDG